MRTWPPLSCLAQVHSLAGTLSQVSFDSGDQIGRPRNNPRWDEWEAVTAATITARGSPGDSERSPLAQFAGGRCYRRDSEAALARTGARGVAEALLSSKPPTLPQSSGRAVKRDRKAQFDFCSALGSLAFLPRASIFRPLEARWELPLVSRTEPGRWRFHSSLDV